MRFLRAYYFEVVGGTNDGCAFLFARGPVDELDDGSCDRGSYRNCDGTR